MTELHLKNMEIVPAMNFLSKMTLVNKESRCRNKLLKMLGKALTGLQESETELLEAYGVKDENGEFKRTPDGNGYELKKGTEKQYASERKLLLEEVVSIKGGMYAQNISQVQEILYNYSGELSGIDAEIYDRLLDEFENNEEKDAV